MREMIYAITLLAFSGPVADARSNGAHVSGLPREERCAIAKIIAKLESRVEIDGKRGIGLAQSTCAKSHCSSGNKVIVAPFILSQTGRTPLMARGESCQDESFEVLNEETFRARARDGSLGYVKIEIIPWHAEAGADRRAVSVLEFSMSVASFSGMSSTATCGEERGLLVWDGPQTWRRVGLLMNGHLAFPAKNCDADMPASR
jgi:hypothetical protein